MSEDRTRTGGRTASSTRLASYQAEAEEHRRTQLNVEHAWSWSRLITFFVGAIAWFAVSDASRALLVAGAFGVMFVVSVVRHLRARREREFTDRLLLMISESKRRVGGHAVTVRSGRRPDDVPARRASPEPVLDPGDTWLLTGQERDDLDLYAEPAGVFGLLNRTSTAMGARRLRDRCEHPCLTADAIEARQACVRWLDDRMERRLRVMADIAILRRLDDRLEAFLEAVRSAAPLNSPGRTVLLRAWSLLSGAFICCALVPAALGVPGWLGALLTLVTINAAIYLRLRRTLNQRLLPWRNVAHVVRGLTSGCRRAALELPGDTELRRLRARFADAVAPGVLPALIWRLDLANTGGTIHAVLNILALYDLHVADAILGRILPNRETILAALAAIADLEVLTGLACFADEQPVAAYPTIIRERTLVIAGGVHPLVSPDRVVANDASFSANARVRIVTGSNMAGKSTYLRMLGVNVLLAQLGGAVAAREMRLTPVRLVTDLRIRDDLAKEESYFLAEVRQIRRMLLPPPGDAPLLGLIDEPFRGTNSSERIAASVAVMQYLMDSDHFFVVATHEQRLTKLADGSVAVNHHFQEDLGSDGPVFGYALQPGPARMRNALRILEREGYPQAVLDRASNEREAHEGTTRSMTQPHD